MIRLAGNDRYVSRKDKRGFIIIQDTRTNAIVQVDSDAWGMFLDIVQMTDRANRGQIR